MDQLGIHVDEMCRSLYRACDVFTGWYIERSEGQDPVVVIACGEQLPDALKKTAKRYILQYLKDKGWKVHGIRAKKDHIEFSIKTSPPKPSPEGQKTPP